MKGLLVSSPQSWCLSSDLSEVREEGEPRIWKYVEVSHLDEGRGLGSKNSTCKVPEVGMCLTHSRTNNNSEQRAEGWEMMPEN